MGGIKLSRRTFAGAGLASAGLVLASGARAFQARPLTAESIMGPFGPVTLPADHDADLTWVKGRSARSGQVIEISGRVFDVKAIPFPALASSCGKRTRGRYPPERHQQGAARPEFDGIASITADSKGEWRIVTIKPGGYDSPIGHRPPHVHFDVRGKQHRNVAQLYFPEESAGNAKDELYKMLGKEAATSVAVRNAADAHKYAWDIVLMG